MHTYLPIRNYEKNCTKLLMENINGEPPENKTINKFNRYAKTGENSDNADRMDCLTKLDAFITLNAD